MQLIPLLQKIKDLYFLWYGYYKTLPKEHRYTLGGRIDVLLVEIIEAIVSASFLSKEEKQSYIKIAIRKNDTVKVFLLILWETKSLDNKKYIILSEKINEIGRMLGGWNGQLTKQNSPTK
ncbi:MAG: four helix bundle protein [Patescibacteria group bacterium]|nr:four helix bundle protein [Patescibacteria group bacterium]